MTTFALVGSPNSGKSTLFNFLTGKNQKVANYPGATVESAIGSLEDGVKVIDLPGIYGLRAHSLDERISRDYIIQNNTNKFLKKFATEELDYHTLVVVADSTKLRKSLYLCMELLELKLPIILVLNRKDLADKRKQRIDVKKLSQNLDIPILETSSFDKGSILCLKETLIGLGKKEAPSKESIDKKKLHALTGQGSWSKDKFDRIDSAINDSIIQSIAPNSTTEKVDKYLTHPIWGGLILLVSLFIIFQTLFTYAAPFQDLITASFDYLGEIVIGLNLPTVIESFFIDGVIAGVGGILVFLPQIVFLYFFIGLMEESGYLPRVAYLLDTYMVKMGLPGKAVIPLLSSHACAIPGIMAARTLGSHRDRLVTILIAPLTTCSARLPVYTLLLATFLPIHQQGLGLLILYVVGIVSSFAVAWAIKQFNPPTNSQHLLFELPPYQLPRLGLILPNVRKKAMIFIKKAGTVILFLTIALWFLSYFPSKSDGTPPAIKDSYAGTIGKTFHPVFKPLGFDVEMTTALIPSFAAREIMVASMGTVMSISDPESDKGIEELQNKIQRSYPVGTILALIVWFIFSPQCISTFAVIKKETGGYKWALVTFGYTFLLAYSMAFFTNLIF